MEENLQTTANTDIVQTEDDDDLTVELELLKSTAANEETDEQRLARLEATLADEGQRGLVADTGVGAFNGVLNFAQAGANLVRQSLTPFGAFSKWITEDEISYSEAWDWTVANEQKLRRNRLDHIEENIPQPETTLGMVTEGATEFLVPFGGLVKGVQAIRGGIALGTAGYATVGAVVDFNRADPDAPLVSNLIQSYPSLENPVTEFLALDDSDSELVKRSKAALEGIVLGLIADGVVKAGTEVVNSEIAKKMSQQVVDSLEYIRRTRIRRGQEQALEETPSAASTKLEKLTPEDIEAQRSKPKATVKETVDDLDEPVESTVDDAVEQATEENRVLENHKDEPDYEPTQADLDDLEARVTKEVNESFKDGGSDILARYLKGENVDISGHTIINHKSFNWEGIETPEEADRLFNIMADQLQGVLGKDVPGNTVPLATTKKLAGMLGYEAETVLDAFDTVAAGGKNALSVRVYAAGQVIEAAHKEASRLAQIAAKTMDPSDILRAELQLDRTMLLAAKATNVTSEVGRALNAAKAVKTTQKLLNLELIEPRRQDEMIKDLQLRLRRPRKKVGEHLNDIAEADNLDDLASRLRKNGRRGGLSEAILEFSQTNLLLNPGTQIVNVMGSVGKTFLMQAEEYLAAGLGAVRRGTMGAAEVADMEQAMSFTYGYFSAIREGSSNMLTYMKTGTPQLDPILRDNLGFDPAIYLDPAKYKNVPSGVRNAVNKYGEIARLSFKALGAADEFFETLTYRASLHRNALIVARRRAGKYTFKTPEEYADFVTQAQERLVASPTEELRLAAITDARYVTFKEEAQTVFGGPLERLVNTSPILKATFAPFVKTPMNIIRQGTMDYTLLGTALRRNREDGIINWAKGYGGREADLALSRQLIGTTFFAGALMLAEEGILTPSLYYDDSKRIGGPRQKSIAVGDDEFASFERMDPFAIWLGMAADFHYLSERAEANYDPNASSLLNDYAEALIRSFGTNVFSKTWMSDISEMANALTSNREDAVERASNQFITNQARKLIPFSSLQNAIGNSMDPHQREAIEISEKLQRIIPGLREDLPIRRDDLGRAMSNELMSPVGKFANVIQLSKEFDTPTDKALREGNFSIRPLQKKLDGIELSASQFSELKRLFGQEPLTSFNGKTLHEALDEFVQTETYLNASDSTFLEGGKEFMIKKFISAARREAKARLLFNDEDLAARIKAAQEAAQTQLRGN